MFWYNIREIWPVKSEAGIPYLGYRFGQGHYRKRAHAWFRLMQGPFF
jgi:hypothetical protein